MTFNLISLQFQNLISESYFYIFSHLNSYKTNINKADAKLGNREKCFLMWNAFHMHLKKVLKHPSNTTPEIHITGVRSLKTNSISLIV